MSFKLTLLFHLEFQPMYICAIEKAVGVPLRGPGMVWQMKRAGIKPVLYLQPSYVLLRGPKLYLCHA